MNTRGKTSKDKNKVEMKPLPFLDNPDNKSGWALWSLSLILADIANNPQLEKADKLNESDR
jgi:hypothetical protein